tara:strand:- start:1387 stop:1557 length:171 start_codon:yes stop_codon:yes gene_type:complete
MLEQFTSMLAQVSSMLVQLKNSEAFFNHLLERKKRSVSTALCFAFIGALLLLKRAK